MFHFKIAAKAGGLFGASLLAIGLAAASVQMANSAPLQVLPATAVTPDPAIVEAKFRRNRAVPAPRVRRSRVYRGRPVYRSRRAGNPAAAAAIIGAFGAVAAAAIAAESRRDRVYYHQPYNPVYGGYGYPAYNTGYEYPNYGYGAAYPVYSDGHYRSPPRYRGVYRAPLYGGGTSVYAVRPGYTYRGLPRAYPNAVPVHGAQRVYRGGVVNGARRVMRRVF